MNKRCPTSNGQEEGGRYCSELSHADDTSSWLPGIKRAEDARGKMWLSSMGEVWGCMGKLPSFK